MQHMSIWGSLKGIEHPYHYEASHVLPDNIHDVRDGTREVHLAYLATFVRFYRDHPEAVTQPDVSEPEGNEPWLRFGVGDSTVILSAKQVRSLVRQMKRWLRTVEEPTQET